MGKRNSKGWSQNSESKSKVQRIENDDCNDDSERPIFRSKAFELFYQIQGIVKVEEWNSFMTTLRDPLPASFRINSDCAYKANIVNELNSLLGNELIIDGTKVRPFQPLEWYPDQLAYKLGCDKRQIRKNPELKKLQDWLIRYTTVGVITRQEEVSMAPPMFLNVEPESLVLDMCAAPGSKTAQILEKVVGNGLVIANDVKKDRAYMLAHQCRRSVSLNMCVTWCNAQAFPSLGPDAELKRGVKRGVFDRVLCDVPCSGDGTIRKAPNIWYTWSAHCSISLHPIQLGIAMRGCALLKVGGTMVYSTCSMCPYENEAIVAEVLRSTQGALKLVDVSHIIPGFIRRPGLCTWSVLDDKFKAEAKLEKKKNRLKKNNNHSPRDKKVELEEDEVQLEEEDLMENVAALDSKSSKLGYKSEKVLLTEATPENLGNIFPTLDGDPIGFQGLVEKIRELGYEHYPNFESVPNSANQRLRKSFFPPTPQEAEDFHLNRCMRFMPHDQDTGGFFVAVFEKIRELNFASGINAAEKKQDNALVEKKIEHEQVPNDTPKLKPQVHRGKNGKFQHLPQDGEKQELVPYDMSDWEEIKLHYGITDDFPANRLYVRVHGAKMLYLVSDTVKSLILDKQVANRLQVIGSGVKVFERNSSQRCACSFRICFEGLNHILPYLTKRVHYVSNADFSIIISGGTMEFSSVSKDLQQRLENELPGSLVMVLKRHESFMNSTLALPVWRDKLFNVLVKKEQLGAIKDEMQCTGEYMRSLALKADTEICCVEEEKLVSDRKEIGKIE